MVMFAWATRMDASSGNACDGVELLGEEGSRMMKCVDAMIMAVPGGRSGG